MGIELIRDGELDVVGRRHAQAIELGNADYGARLAKLRKDAGMSQLQLAEKLGITQSLISRYERGDRRMYDDLLAEVARILGVTPNDILGIGATKKINTDEESISRRLVKNMKRIESLPRRAQDKLIATIEMALKGAAN